MKMVWIFAVLSLTALSNVTLQAAEPPQAILIRNFVDAYNAHDINRMMEYVSDDIKLIYVSKSVSATDAESKEQLRGILAEYFASYPDSRSEIEHVNVTGRFVTAKERAVWTTNGMENTQYSLAVYEICGKLICAVWYYPPQRD